MTLEEQAAQLSQAEIVSLLVLNNSHQEEIRRYQAKNSDLKRQVAWFKRQIWGRKSEKRIFGSDAKQLSLAEDLSKEDAPPPPKETVKEYQRKRRKAPLEGSPDDTGLRFDSSVPVQEIDVPNPELEGLSADDYELIEEKCTYRLAQRPGSYVVLKYQRKVVKIKERGELSTPPAPAAVLEKSYADVSLLVGILIDKFLYHIPLFRQHQRLMASGIMLSRVSLTNWMHRIADLLEPVYYAHLSSILESKVLAMDEVPIKAGLKERGKMQTGYFWPLYGDKDEIAFPFYPSRATAVVREVLGSWCGTLLTDGYEAYQRFAAKRDNVTHAQCWSHTRRKFIAAEKAEPKLVEEALKFIRELYHQEKVIREKNFRGEKKLFHRTEHSKPLVDQFFSWIKETFRKQALLPSSPLTKALSYALKREAGLMVFLQDPEVPLDTNHLERGLRPIPMGRKNWLFCWTEIGAKYVGIIQSLLQSCRLHNVDPYTYLVDVLQRTQTHTAFEVHLLTPRLWKENFAMNPLRSDLDRHNNVVV